MKVLKTTREGVNVNTGKIYKGIVFSAIVLGGIAMTAAPVYAADGKAVFEKTCKLCHGSGVAGAPKAGDAAAWNERVAKGNETLYAHAINGFRGKAFMPPKGGNKKLSDDEVRAAVDHMLKMLK